MPRNPGTYALTAFMFLLLFSAPANGGPSTRVFLTEVAGSVYKRAFVDWNREQWGEPVPARRGDELFEGMQIGTGERSRAQVTWPYVTTRAWSNSVYAIA